MVATSTNGPNFRLRGAEFDHVWRSNPRAGAKRVVIVFPLSKSGSIPLGAKSDPASIDPAGNTISAVFEMYINPDQLQFRHPTRSQVIQTIGGAYIDSFGAGLTVGSLSGSFGWGQDKDLRTGLDRMGTLKKLYHGWQELTTTLATPCHMMLAGNEKTDAVNMLLHLGDLEITRSKGSPLTINYSLSFTVLHDYNGPVNPQVLPPIGIVPKDGGTPGGTRTRETPNEHEHDH